MGPKPGNNPKNVGDADSPQRGRFVCLTNPPPENSLRSMNACGSTFSKLTDGVSFHVDWKKLGRLMPVFQSTVVRKSLLYVMTCFFDESVGSYTVFVNGKSFRLSAYRNVFVHVNSPILSGVSKFALVCLVLRLI